MDYGRSADCDSRRLVVEVWWARLSQLSESVQQGVGRLLSPVERARAAAYCVVEDRLRFQAGVAITRLVLAGRLGCLPGEVRLDRTCLDCGRPHGKVRLAGPWTGWELSVSHSGDLVGVAVSTVAPVGLDVEQVRDLEVEPVASLVLTPAECRDLFQAGAGSRDLLRYWTRKEAVVKSTGDGLRQPLNLIAVTGPAEGAALTGWVGREETVAGVGLFDLAHRVGYVASLAVLSRAEVRIVERDAEPVLRAWGQV